MSESPASRASTSEITLLYAGAATSALIATFLILLVLGQLFSMWTSTAGNLLLMSGYVGIVTAAVAAVLFALIAFMLYRKVTTAVGAQPEFLRTSSYRFITNAFVALMGLAFVITGAELVSVLISSLLLIGTNTDIGGLYLNKFLPGLVAAGVIGFVGFAGFKIMKGKNMSPLMTLVLLSVAGALLLATLITVPIKAHASTSNTRTLDYSKYLDGFSN